MALYNVVRWTPGYGTTSWMACDYNWRYEGRVLLITTTAGAAVTMSTRQSVITVEEIPDAKSEEPAVQDPEAFERLERDQDGEGSETPDEADSGQGSEQGDEEAAPVKKRRARLSWVEFK